MNKYIFVIIAAATFLIATTTADAQYGCPPYGAECPPSSKIVVDKQIRDPRNGNYVDNLTLADYKFAPGEDVIFKITIKNTGNKDVENVEGVDTIPQLTDTLLLSGETRESLRELTKNFGTLKANETRTWFIRVRVKASDQIPAGTVCGDPKAINRITVRAKDMPNATDTSSFCIQKSVLGATKQPESGSPLLIIATGLSALAGIGFAGQKLSYKLVK
jgi:uncharacterized repeat protein (TIGR01451 family)